MGLFDMFKGNNAFEITPYSALAVSMIYVIAADGEINENEIGQLIAILGGEQPKGINTRDLIKNASKYVNATKVEDFLKDASGKLTGEQKMCILINILDTIFADGNAASEEQELFFKFIEAFGYSENDLKPALEIITLKNNKNVLL